MYEIGFVKDPFNYFSEIRKIEDTPQFTFNKFDFFLLPREREHSNNNHQRMFVEMTKCLHKNIFCDNDDGYHRCISGYLQIFINFHIFVRINIALFCGYSFFQSNRKTFPPEHDLYSSYCQNSFYWLQQTRSNWSMMRCNCLFENETSIEKC